MKLFSQSKLWLVVANLSLSISLSSPVSASEIPAERLQISPGEQTFLLVPGETFRSTIKVQNTGSRSFNYQLSVTPYSVTDNKYSPDFETLNSYTTLSNWVTFDWETGVANPNDSIEVPFTINVPKDVPSGGQYAAIMAQIARPESTPDHSSGNTIGITAVARAAMLLRATIPGNTREEGAIIENNVPSFLFTNPITVSSLVKNTGNIHIEAKYALQVFPLFSDEEVYTTEENPDTRTILPETSRFHTLSWDGAPQLGLFRVVQTVSFLNETSKTSRILFICPMWFLLIILFFFFFCVFWLIARARSRQKLSQKGA